MSDIPTNSEQIEDSDPLSPLQQGMLFHSLLVQRSGVDIVQMLSALSEDLDAAAFERAWQRIGQRSPVLFSDLSVFYPVFSREKASPLPELPIQYADYAVWQRGSLGDGDLERELSYWRRKLGSASPVLDQKGDRPRPAIRTSRGASHAIRLERGLGVGIAALGRREGATTFMTLLGIFLILLARQTGEENLIVDCPSLGRHLHETEDIFACPTDLFDAATIERLARRFAALVSQVVAQPGARVRELQAELDAADEHERRQNRRGRTPSCGDAWKPAGGEPFAYE